MIQPTVGRVVWLYKYNSVSGHHGPLAAHVCKVHSDTYINVMAISEEGTPFSEISVFLQQDDSAGPPSCTYCSWMPYQKGQAAKTEALEKAIVK